MGIHERKAKPARLPLSAVGLVLCLAALLLMLCLNPGGDPLSVRMGFSAPEALPGREALALADELAGAADQSLQEVSGSLEYVRKAYSLPPDAKAGPAADPSLFGETADPSVITELLRSPIARQLIGGQELTWNEDIEYIPGSSIHYYLDETILVLVWQEEAARAVGTFAEVIVSDASQLRRKLVNDTFDANQYEYATTLSQQTNAVLALGGDMYDHPSRNNGICVYEGEILRFEPDTSDSCFFTDTGDMLFAYRYQFETREEAEAFVKDNKVMFSVCFGPVLIDGGKDVTPMYYTWGEIYDTYARSAIGQLGELHYLAMTINCQRPDYDYLADIWQLTDEMLERGCEKAYALDGGQTASIIINHELINPVQFGYERFTSDIIYFATAIPEKDA